MIKITTYLLLLMILLEHLTTAAKFLVVPCFLIHLKYCVVYFDGF